MNNLPDRLGLLGGLGWFRPNNYTRGTRGQLYPEASVSGPGWCKEHDLAL